MAVSTPGCADPSLATAPTVASTVQPIPRSRSARPAVVAVSAAIAVAIGATGLLVAFRTADPAPASEPAGGTRSSPIATHVHFDAPPSPPESAGPRQLRHRRHRTHRPGEDDEHLRPQRVPELHASPCGDGRSDNSNNYNAVAPAPTGVGY